MCVNKNGMIEDKQSTTYRGVLIHASAVEYRGKAVVFLGPSETGKSTISQLLAATLDGARVLADDIAYLAWRGRGWQVAGDMYPHFQQEVFAAPPIHVSQSVPLGGIFRLYQAPLSRLEPMDNSETGFCLVRAFFEVIMHRYAGIGEKKAYFSSLSAVARVTPGFTFYFERSPQTATVFRRALGVS